MKKETVFAIYKVGSMDRMLVRHPDGTYDLMDEEEVKECFNVTSNGDGEYESEEEAIIDLVGDTTIVESDEPDILEDEDRTYIADRKKKNIADGKSSFGDLNFGFE